MSLPVLLLVLVLKLQQSLASIGGLWVQTEVNLLLLLLLVPVLPL